ncbi:NAC domain-containing protein 62 [Amborella trichopoda]|uniref:NAC domain-containing protein 62 n=1 Tax=Amborella trichopoda TaxID=13333 RepID=UPI0005D410D4|nr:NAC domain-containing protein 62 [Amborella trichopoda]|eukprot:XP_011624192.1 NAC domain-containing protein 62 [Amborella trichopoda]
MAVMSLESLPPGFRFGPTDEELVSYYLRRKINGGRGVQVIPEVDMCKCEPWDLPGKSIIKNQDPEWFFFCPRDRKYPNGRRSNRATKAGYWKATGNDRPIKSKSHGSRSDLIGTKKTLVFHEGRAPHGKKTHWIVHEYRANGNAFQDLNGSQDAYVLWRLFKKDGLNEKRDDPSYDGVELSDLSPDPSKSSTGGVVIDGEHGDQLDQTSKLEVKETNVQETSSPKMRDSDYVNKVLEDMLATDDSLQPIESQQHYKGDEEQEASELFHVPNNEPLVLENHVPPSSSFCSNLGTFDDGGLEVSTANWDGLGLVNSHGPSSVPSAESFDEFDYLIDFDEDHLGERDGGHNPSINTIGHGQSGIVIRERQPGPRYNPPVFPFQGTALRRICLQKLSNGRAFYEAEKEKEREKDRGTLAAVLLGLEDKTEMSVQVKDAPPVIQLQAAEVQEGLQHESYPCVAQIKLIQPVRRRAKKVLRRSPTRAMGADPLEERKVGADPLEERKVVERYMPPTCRIILLPDSDLESSNKKGMVEMVPVALNVNVEEIDTNSSRGITEPNPLRIPKSLKIVCASALAIFAILLVTVLSFVKVFFTYSKSSISVVL